MPYHDHCPFGIERTVSFHKVVTKFFTINRLTLLHQMHWTRMYHWRSPKKLIRSKRKINLREPGHKSGWLWRTGLLILVWLFRYQSLKERNSLLLFLTFCRLHLSWLRCTGTFRFYNVCVETIHEARLFSKWIKGISFRRNRRTASVRGIIWFHQQWLSYLDISTKLKW